MLSNSLKQRLRFFPRSQFSRLKCRFLMMPERIVAFSRTVWCLGLGCMGFDQVLYDLRCTFALKKIDWFKRLWVCSFLFHFEKPELISVISTFNQRGGNNQWNQPLPVYQAAGAAAWIQFAEKWQQQKRKETNVNPRWRATRNAAGRRWSEQWVVKVTQHNWDKKGTGRIKHFTPTVIRYWNDKGPKHW